MGVAVQLTAECNQEFFLEKRNVAADTFCQTPFFYRTPSKVVPFDSPTHDNSRNRKVSFPPVFFSERSSVLLFKKNLKILHNMLRLAVWQNNGLCWRLEPVGSVVVVGLLCDPGP